jgi:hypothetical protein
MDPSIDDGKVVALQHFLGKMPHATRRRTLWADQPPWGWQRAPLESVTAASTRRLVIQGITRDGRTFRPSDWAERLVGAMSSFRPEGVSGGIGAFIGYSPYCVPRVVDGVKSVIVDEALRAIEPMAWDFVTHFARDNDLVTLELPPTERLPAR